MESGVGPRRTTCDVRLTTSTDHIVFLRVDLTAAGSQAHLLHALTQHDEDLHVEKDGQKERNEEGAAGRVENVARRVEQDTVVDIGSIIADVVACQVVPAEQRRHTDGRRQAPDDGDVEESLV